MKRSIPLFVIDTVRAHKLGEYDFIVCTDIRSGFIARCEYIEGVASEAGDDYRISAPANGISMKISVERYIGTNPDVKNVRTLLKQAEKLYMSCVQQAVDFGDIKVKDCIGYMRTLSRSAQDQMDGCKSDYSRRQVIAYSKKMIDKTKEYLEELERMSDGE